MALQFDLLGARLHDCASLFPKVRPPWWSPAAV